MCVRRQEGAPYFALKAKVAYRSAIETSVRSSLRVPYGPLQVRCRLEEYVTC
jgi:hypothetical protein